MTPAARARTTANLTPEQAARKARIGVRYLLAVERCGCDSLALAERLAALYGCRVDVFLDTVKRGNKRAMGCPRTVTPQRVLPVAAEPSQSFRHE